jgi:hypothetical protein
MAEVVKYLESTVPCIAGRVSVAVFVVAVAEVGQRVGLALALADLVEEVHRAFVTRSALAVVAELVLGVAQAVPGGSLAAAVAEFLKLVEGLPAVRDGLFVVAEQGVVPTDVVEGVRLTASVPGGLVEVQAQLGVGERLAEA